MYSTMKVAYILYIKKQSTGSFHGLIQIQIGMYSTGIFLQFHEVSEMGDISWDIW
jgi:hypothetical protein